MNHVTNLFNYRDLLWMWTLREVRIRYKQSAIGGLWAILQPLSLMLIFTFVFSLIARVPSVEVPYPVFSYVALVPWTFLTTSLSFAVPSLVSNMNLVTKIYFPREILPIASVSAAFLDAMIASLLLFVMMVVYKISLSVTLIWVPLIVLIQVLLILGIAFLLSALNVFYRDIRFVIPLATQLWLYASPVIYPISLVPEQFLPIYMLNPMAGIIESYRRVILLGVNPVWSHLGISAAISAVLFVSGYAYFKRSENLFADLI
ncbi:MAG: ABC transporter permease [Candidatus Promineifilaceae bacterium]